MHMSCMPAGIAVRALTHLRSLPRVTSQNGGTAYDLTIQAGSDATPLQMVTRIQVLPGTGIDAWVSQGRSAGGGGGVGLCGVGAEVAGGVAAGSDDEEHRHGGGGLRGERGHAVWRRRDAGQAELGGREAVQRRAEAVRPDSLHRRSMLRSSP